MSRIDSVPPFVILCKLEVYDFLYSSDIYIRPDDGYILPPKRIAEILFSCFYRAIIEFY